ncbi:MAG TPA: iron ABC transporter permease [Gaiella sp.]|nr:iron ABC transporter permease [Gaiella sp.]
MPAQHVPTAQVLAPQRAHSLAQRAARAATVAIPVAFLALFFAWPLLAILRRSLVVDGALDVPLDVLTASTTREIAWFTLWQATVSTVLTLLAGLPLAWALSRFSFRGRSLVEALVLVPFVLPTVVVATAFVALLPDGMEHSVWAILLAHVFFNVAVVVRIVGAYWGALDARLWDAAATLGAGPAQRQLRLTLPLLAPALASAASIAFLFCFTSFGVIVVLGGIRYATLETEIYNQAARLFDLRTAAALALLQLAAVAAVVTVSGVLERRLGGARRAGRRPPRPRHGERLTVAAVVAVSLGLLALPPLALVVRSLQVSGGYGLRHFASLFDTTPALLVSPWHAILNSLVFATAATAIALGVGVPAAIAVASGSRGLDVTLMLPLGASAAMLGFGFLLAFDRAPLDLRSSLVIVPLAQALVATPFVVRSLVPALRARDPRLPEAAAALGATPSQVRREIELPLIARPLAVAAGLAFAVALGEFGATVFVFRADWPTVPVAIFRFLGRPGADNVGTAMALCVVLMALVVLASLLSQRGLGRSAR